MNELLQLISEHGPMDWFAIRRHLYEAHCETRAADTARQLQALVANGELHIVQTGIYALPVG